MHAQSGFAYYLTQLKCDGGQFSSGSCNPQAPNVTYIMQNITSGDVCVGTFYEHSVENYNQGWYADIWKDCVIGATSAEEYYVGYVGDGTPTRTDINWLDTGTNWTAPRGYRINRTEHTENCSLQKIPSEEQDQGWKYTTTNVQIAPVFQLAPSGTTHNPIDAIISWIKDFLRSLGVKI